MTEIIVVEDEHISTAEVQLKHRNVHLDGIPPSDTLADLSDNRNLQRPRRTPLPKIQLSILLFIQLAEPVTCTVIYPFVNQLVRQTGITGGDERKTGYFAGLIESLFYATEAATVLQWGRISDRVGRRPILLVGLFGLMLSTLSFGVSKSYWQLILSRCAEGALNGNVGVTKSMMAEITDPSNLAQGFAFLPMVWATGQTLGPIVGGMLSLPASRWPEAFARVPFFTKYPYFLPCLVVACVCAAAFLLVLVGLEETLPRAMIRQKRNHDSQGTVAKDLVENNSQYFPPTSEARTGFPDSTLPPNEIVADHSGFTEKKGCFVTGAPTNRTADSHSPPSLRSLLNRRVLVPIMNYAFLAFIDQCMTVLQPLMYSTSIPLGGLSFSSFTIGAVMGVWGVINGFVQIFAFPVLLRIVGPRKMYMTAFASYLVCIGAYPLMSFLAKQAGRVDAKVWIVLVVQLSAYVIAYLAYGCVFIYISQSAPSREALGATNGIAQTTASTMRALAPSTASSLFSLSLEQNLAGGTAVYWILWAVIIVGLCSATQLPPRLLAEESTESIQRTGDTVDNP
ncbi:hypothetical protein SERLADRAFT_415754 [Serpula lacrymans var. lacrymans S7.9]|uniref:Major facilitator superfamily (MFS) profile domain-containing protein n=1 Tax=Serpula lacrymans var. lacrymans (strain S7.9) TaxID=578457 RepID=F8NXW7_SERL9|nr:uncharacterized protein SERLADRAFT_415754 [Serpula lacrymans var. lacrymans S7.9]EGO24783.1 hypothetical protein SERLADRAFT_415754 [Serpula lacrymans var. lacrymans S7.9]